MSEVYNQYVDTAGNYNYTDVETGHHVIPNTAVGYFPPPRLIKTNADHIRSMTDEELAEFFDNTCIENLGKVRCDSYGRCYDCMLDWLKEEGEQ